MTKPKDALELVPIEVLRVIPLYNGDKTQLNLFLRKCEYVIDMYKGNDEQNLYLLHTITSRLVDRAASLLSERGDVNSWNKLKDLLIENYSDTRSEESIELEFQSLKINPSENFSSFYKRLQALHRILISKVDNNIDEAEKCKKVDQYNKMAITVLLYSLPEYLVNMVRLKQPSTLEQAYIIVTEEISFFKRYSMNQSKCLNTIPEFRYFCTNRFQPFHNIQSNINSQTFGGTQSVGSSQGSLFGCSSFQAQSGQNKKGSSIFGLSQNGTSPFGLPQNGTLSYAGFGQGNNSGIKTNIPSQSVAPTSQALHLNEEE